MMLKTVQEDGGQDRMEKMIGLDGEMKRTAKADAGRRNGQKKV